MATKEKEKSVKVTIDDLKKRVEAGANLGQFSDAELDLLEEEAPDLVDKLWGESIVGTLNDPESHDKSN